MLIVEQRSSWIFARQRPPNHQKLSYSLTLIKNTSIKDVAHLKCSVDSRLQVYFPTDSGALALADSPAEQSFAPPRPAVHAVLLPTSFEPGRRRQYTDTPDMFPINPLSWMKTWSWEYHDISSASRVWDWVKTHYGLIWFKPSVSSFMAPTSINLAGFNGHVQPNSEQSKTTDFDDPANT